MKEINPLSAVPLSDATISGDLIFISGQVGLDRNGKLAEGFEKQMKQTLANLKGVLEAAGSKLDGVLKTTVYLTDMSNVSDMNRLYAEFFANRRPARATIGISQLPVPGALIEIEAIAEL